MDESKEKQVTEMKMEGTTPRGALLGIYGSAG